MATEPTPPNTPVQLGPRGGGTCGLIKVRRKEIFMMHNVVLGVFRTAKTK
jgi:hypothetical protein